MNIKYFQDTDTLLVTLTNHDVAETKDLSENVLVDVDRDGNVVSLTIEHAGEQASMDSFSYQQVRGSTAEAV
jgi:uncharacterized protein YuzE